MIVEGTLGNVLACRGDMSEASLLGTVAAWSRRYCPIVFAGDERHAAELAWRYLAGQVKEARKVVQVTSSVFNQNVSTSTAS